jgi:hypothetical protein
MDSEWSGRLAANYPNAGLTSQFLDERRDEDLDCVLCRINQLHTAAIRRVVDVWPAGS